MILPYDANLRRMEFSETTRSRAGPSDLLRAGEGDSADSTAGRQMPHFCENFALTKQKLSNHTIDVKHAARVLLSNLLDLTRRKARFSKRVHRGQVSRRE